MISKKHVALGILLVIALVVAALVIRGSKKAMTKPSLGQSPTKEVDPLAARHLNVLSADYPQISLKSRTKEEAVRIWLQRLKTDSKADWKVPIEFYGQVVDQTLRPVGNATVHFRWTNLSNNGTGSSDTVSDDSGLFQLGGVDGKRLSVQIEKRGYYRSEGSFKSFEFSNPGEDIYYEPDKNDPVVFHLHKAGEGVRIIKKSIKIFLPNPGSSMNVDLDSGNIGSVGQLVVETWKPWPPKPISPHYDWKVQLSIANGGFADAPQEFAFEAPETGYNPSFAIDMPASRGNNWSVSAEKTLYFTFGEPKKYGWLHFRTDGNSRYVFIDYVLNPSGSRNLEEASNNTVKNGK